MRWLRTSTASAKAEPVLGLMKAPGRLSRRSGALVFGLVVTLAASACDAVSGGSTITLDSAEVSIDGSVHDVTIAGAGAVDSIAPEMVQARVGDAIRFVVEDRRPHAIMFTAERLEAPVREYLERTSQLRGPPLVNEGSSWVVLLEDAVPGRYPFHCRSHDAAGEITVAAGD